MKRTLSFILVCGLCLAGCLAQKSNEKIVAKFLINGYFYETMPSLPAEITEQGTVASYTLTDKDGIQVQTFRYFTNLPDSIVNLAIPKKRVKNAWYFINQEKEQRRIDNTTTDNEGLERKFIPQVGKMFPLFQEKAVDGRTWSTNDLDGHVTVFYLWYQGCVPALSEMGELSAWKVMYPDVLFFSVTWHDVPTTRRITGQYNFMWNHICNAWPMMAWVNQGVDKNNPSSRDYPVTIVVDRQGVVRRVVSGTGIGVRQETLNCILHYR